MWICLHTKYMYQIKNSEKPERKKKKNPNSTTILRIEFSLLFNQKKYQIRLEKNRQINASFRIFRARI